MQIRFTLMIGLLAISANVFSVAHANDANSNAIYQASDNTQGLDKYKYNVPANSWYMAKIKPKHKGLMKPKDPQPELERRAIPFWENTNTTQ